MPEQLIQRDTNIYGDRNLEYFFPIRDPFDFQGIDPVWDQKKSTFSSCRYEKLGLVSSGTTVSVYDFSYYDPIPSVNLKKTIDIVKIAQNPLILKGDSFTQEDLINIEDAQVQELIFHIKESISIHCHENLANRLITLFKDAKAEDSANIGIAVESLRNFYYFFRSNTNTNLKCPSISLTPDNDIYASWRVERSRIFSVHFLPDDNVQFVIFKPNDKHPEKLFRFSGLVTTDALMELASKYGVNDWISE